MDTNNLSDVILESIEDIELPKDELPTTDDAQPEEPVVEATSTEAAEPVEAKTEETPVEPVETEVKSPAAKAATKASTYDIGIPAKSASGRENRLPHSRVVKIVGNAQKAAVDAYKKEWEPKYTELDTKVKTYESQLTQVAQFEQVMTNDPATFLDDVLGKIPAYKPFFDKVRDLLQKEQAGTLGAAEVAPAKEEVPSDMPQPDKQLADGTSVYTMDGLAKLNAWNRAQAAKQAREEVMKEVEKEYGPIKEREMVQRKIEATLPGVRKQIEAAQKWTGFKENEAEIVKALQADQTLTLEGAYRQVVFPKFATDRNKIREEVLREIKATPRSTSAATSATKAAPASSGPKSLEDVIRESIGGLKG